MSEDAESIELVIKPIPPDTITSVKEEIQSSIELALREAGQGESSLRTAK